MSEDNLPKVKAIKVVTVDSPDVPITNKFSSSINTRILGVMSDGSEIDLSQCVYEYHIVGTLGRLSHVYLGAFVKDIELTGLGFSYGANLPTPKNVGDPLLSLEAIESIDDKLNYLDDRDETLSKVLLNIYHLLHDACISASSELMLESALESIRVSIREVLDPLNKLAEWDSEKINKLINDIVFVFTGGGIHFKAHDPQFTVSISPKTYAARDGFVENEALTKISELLLGFIKDE